MDVRGTPLAGLDLIMDIRRTHLAGFDVIIIDAGGNHLARYDMRIDAGGNSLTGLDLIMDVRVTVLAGFDAGGKLLAGFDTIIPGNNRCQRHLPGMSCKSCQIACRWKPHLMGFMLNDPCKHPHSHKTYTIYLIAAK
jgi:hypothetical protein